MTEDAPQPRRRMYPAYTDKPILLHGKNGDRSGTIFEQAARRRARLRSASQSSSGSESKSSTRSDAGTGAGTIPNWMSGQNTRGMGLQEAFARTDEEYRPKTAPGIVSTVEKNELGKGTTPRTTRSRSSSGSIELKEGTPQVIRDMFERAERDEEAKLTPLREMMAPVDYESAREGSPSPATRDRGQFNRGTTDIKKLVLERKIQDGSEKPLTQYEKDKAYHARLLANPNPILLGRRATEPYVNSARSTRANDIGEAARRPSTSSLEDEPEPPLNIPRSWGARARARPGWLQRVLSPDQSLEIKNEVDSINAEYQRSVADTPLPSVERSEPTPPSSRPASAQPNNEFLEEKSYLQPWDADLDFTGESMLTSSPMLKIKPTKLEQIHEREELVKREPMSEVVLDNDKRFAKPTSNIALNNEKKPAKAVSEIVRDNEEERDETRDDLRELSRLLAPKSPRIVREEEEEADPEDRITAEAKLFELRDDKSEKNSIRAPSASSSDNGKNDETPRPKTVDPLSLPTPKVTGAYVDTPAPSSRKLVSQRSISPTPEAVEPVDDASSDRENQQTGTRGSRSQEDQSQRDTRSRLQIPGKTQSQHTSRSASSQRERPRVINTAKRTTAAEDLRRIKLEENIEDSTLDDLDLLLENEAALKTELMDTNKPIVDLEYDERGLPLTAAEKERRIERVILERMALRLKNTTSSIRDARQGIERLEKEVSTAPIVGAIASDGDADAHYVQLNIKMKLPRLYTVHTPPTSRSQNAGWFANRNWKFTWFGLILAIFAAWYVAETAMCEAFCHPQYSSKNTWQPSDPFFPWAIPTKLDQWTGEVVSGTVKGIETTVMDWYDPNRFKRPVQPKGRPYGANDWWVGKDRPAALYRRPEKAGSIYDDEIYDG